MYPLFVFSDSRWNNVGTICHLGMRIELWTLYRSNDYISLKTKHKRIVSCSSLQNEFRVCCSSLSIHPFISRFSTLVTYQLLSIECFKVLASKHIPPAFMEHRLLHNCVWGCSHQNALQAVYQQGELKL